MSNESVFILGLPEAGKTTFLAALYYFLDSGQSKHFKLGELVGDQSYLSSIATKWANLEPVPRTSNTEQSEISITLVDNENRQSTLYFPDLSGETFQQQYIDRLMKKEHFDYIKKSSGIFVFINPKKVNDTTLISELNLKNHDDDIDFENIVERDPKTDPAQVQLIDLIQFVLEIKTNFQFKLFIIVSAYDTVLNINNKTKPETFIKDKLPLLWQFLTTNSRKYEIQYFGLSAQGGELDDQTLLDIDEPVDRIKIIDSNGKQDNDISKPIQQFIYDTKVSE